MCERFFASASRDLGLADPVQVADRPVELLQRVLGGAAVELLVLARRRRSCPAGRATSCGSGCRSCGCSALLLLDWSSPVAMGYLRLAAFWAAWAAESAGSMSSSSSDSDVELRRLLVLVLLVVVVVLVFVVARPRRRSPRPPRRRAPRPRPRRSPRPPRRRARPRLSSSKSSSSSATGSSSSFLVEVLVLVVDGLVLLQLVDRPLVLGRPVLVVAANRCRRAGRGRDRGCRAGRRGSESAPAWSAGRAWTSRPSRRPRAPRRRRPP